MLVWLKGQSPLIKRLLKVAIVFFILIFFAASFLIFDRAYADRIYPGVYLGQLSVGGLKPEEAASLLSKKINGLKEEGIIFFYNNEKFKLSPLVSSTGGDLSYFLFDLEDEKALEEAWQAGRANSFWLNWREKLSSLIFKKIIYLTPTIREEEIKKILKENFSRFENPGRPAEIKVKAGEGIKIETAAEKSGQSINYNLALSELKTELARLNYNPIALSLMIDQPAPRLRDCLNIESRVHKILALAPLALAYQEQTWEVSQELLADWLNLKAGDAGCEIGISEEKFISFAEKEIAPKINREAMNAKFAVENGRVTEFQGSQNGLALSSTESLKRLEEAISSQTPIIALAAEETKSEVQTENINDLGIREIVGTGQSNFAGSPPNRRHNIKNGADTLHGLLIKPEEEFSLLKALGEINALSGYLPELVIKGNKTIPEYGGGLCQIGTTMFRAALASGLPITMRRNHSYRVQYYEPAGTDATIYDPAPDFRFLNDTGRYLLIQRRIEGDNLYFDFWGTKDGRIIEQTKPVIYNIVKPGPAKIIETTDLKPGEKKCTERAHNGADAYFDYRITYADGALKEKRFSSHYIPWQEVCLVGVEEIKTEETETIAAPEEEKQNLISAEEEKIN